MIPQELLPGPPIRTRALSRGVGGEVLLLEFEGHPPLVVKTRPPNPVGPGLLAEARSLRLLAERSRVPVPSVHHAAEHVLIMDFVPGSSGIAGAETHAAEIVAGLHGITNPVFGLEFDNTIGPWPQDNTPDSSWVDFWRDRRLLARVLVSELPGGLLRRVEALAARLGEFIPPRPTPSLIHGDLWSGNVLSSAGRVRGFLDPAPYFAHAEVELAFMTMFATAGPEFFERYSEVRPIDPEFWKRRRSVYMTYPLLVHVRLFGGGYVAELESILAELGF